jgi:hypothetical protein
MAYVGHGTNNLDQEVDLVPVADCWLKQRTQLGKSAHAIREGFGQTCHPHLAPPSTAVMVVRRSSRGGRSGC